MDNYQYLPRAVTGAFHTAARSMPVVVVTGARQTGKTTFVQHVAEDEETVYLTLDDYDILERARSAPDELLDQPSRIIIDEVQRAPELLLRIKRAVDRRRTPGKFILTGSANLLLAHRVSESLAGRAIHIDLWPLTSGELLGEGRTGYWDLLVGNPPETWLEALRDIPHESRDWKVAVRHGGYPVPAYILEDDDARAAWFAGYVRTYLERDLQDLSAVSDLVDFRRLMQAACLRLGNLVNQTELGRDVGMPQSTVHNHLNLLETSYQLVRIPAFAVNRTKRLIKTPKLYWSDTGLAMHLAGASKTAGAHFENLALNDLLAWRDSKIDRPRILYWRTASGREVDFVIETNQKVLPIEIKATAHPVPADASGLLAFLEEYPDMAEAGLLIHTGERVSWLTKGVLAAPWWRIN